jgi:cytochrome c peroxidase
MNNWKIIFLLALSPILFYSCKPDDGGPDGNPDCTDLHAPGATCGNATPFTFISPASMSKVAVPLDNALTEEGIYLGRLLFYDPILSLDSTQSCATCHKQENAFTDPERFSKGITGALGTRNSMVIFNVLWHRHGFFWDGRAIDLRDQVTKPVTNPVEMAHLTFCDALVKIRKSPLYREHFCKAFGDDEITQLRYEKALEQFLITLVSDNSKFDKIERGEAGNSYSFEELSGRAIFNGEPPEGGDCFHCHGTSTFGTHEYVNNGLDEFFTDFGRFDFTGKERDKGKFKVPSLRNLVFTAPYMHDGRFNTIEEVVNFYVNDVHSNSPNIDPLMKHSNTDFKLDLSEQDKTNLVIYLKTLTDSTFVTNPKFSNPF